MGANVIIIYRINCTAHYDHSINTYFELRKTFFSKFPTNITTTFIIDIEYNVFFSMKPLNRRFWKLKHLILDMFLFIYVGLTLATFYTFNMKAGNFN